MALSLGTNGVRATFNKLNPQAAADFAFAFSRSISKKRSSMPTIAIARDMRKTSPCLMQAAASAIMEGGANALDIGLLPSPVAEWASMYFKCAGLIIITASHNPPEYNALKFVDGRGVAISRERGAHFSKYLGKTHSPSLPWQSVGKLIKQENVLQEYEKQRTSLDYYERTAMPTAALLLNNAQKAFRAGDVGYLEYVQALTRANDIRLGYLETLGGYNAAVIAIEWLTGN